MSSVEVAGFDSVIVPRANRVNNTAHSLGPKSIRVAAPAPPSSSASPDTAKRTCEIPPNEGAHHRLSFASGVLALAGHPWWAILPAVAAVIVGSNWISGRRLRTNEPRLGPISLVAGVFGAWLVLPIYRAIRFGETATFPEILVLAGLAPAVWLAYYLCLLIRR